MSDDNKVKYLVVDTSAFIRNVPLQDIGVNIITDQNVVNEIRNKRQLRRLVVLPYDLVIKDTFAENIKFVTEFAKKTGDYTSLSATDIKVIALTYQLEKEHVGTSHLKEVPQVPKTIDASHGQLLDHPKSVAGFYIPGAENDSETDEDEHSELAENKDKDAQEAKNENETMIVNTKIREQKQRNESDETGSNEEEDCSPLELSDSADESDYLTAVSDMEEPETDDLASKFKTLNCNHEDLKVEGELGIDEILVPVEPDSESNEDSGDGGSEGNDEDSDDGGWITPSNIAQAKKSMEADIVAEKTAIVACMTTDFAMQNVLKQIGLNVAALDGRVIKQMRTFIFRCYACFKTTSIMTKVFCPSCGLKTLKKVAVSLDDEGKQQIHINFRKPLSSKGKRFSLPTPKGGKHAVNPILCEDQPVPDQRPSRLARMKNDPLNDDYIAGYSPFVMRDVTSKSAMLGIRPGSGVKYWMKKNPNEPRRKRK
ncbi:RNA-binding protein NOB1 [Venturia canescens]|uniref:RNA-binding protein NOB1 n=1 Tax=Venturia canescens TaxID=32260 RepID=UPI001C9D070E|nr:RNA-binding protein NOB1 [Venturia canescens]